MHARLLLLASALLTGFTSQASAQYPGWQHEGSLFILTTPEGADVSADATVEGFPLLVRLEKASFEFSQANPKGEDLRFSAAGKPLAYQIEKWEPAHGKASVWVRIPQIKGNARQEIKVHWGKPDAASESNGSAVFSADNGYVSVIHMNETLKDELGAVTPEDGGTTVAAGIIGNCRRFVPGKAIKCGDNIKNYPFSNNPFTSECWFRAEKADTSVLCWGRYAKRFNGNTGDGNLVNLTFGSPPALLWNSDGGGGAKADVVPKLGQWYHMAATFEKGISRIYVNGKLAGSNNAGLNAMSLMNDVYMDIGGHRSATFGGDIDEVRVSQVARSAEWMKLQYENQKSNQTLLGCWVQPGSAFAVSPDKLEVAEGKSLSVTAEAGGAEKIYWIVKRDAEDTIVAVDQLAYTFDAGRVVADTDFVLQFKAVYPNEIKLKNLAVKIKEEIPEPVFYLRAPATWNGRDRLEVSPDIANLKAMQAKGAGDLHYQWSVTGGAVIKEIASDKLILKRSQCSGKITVKLTLNNGGADYATATTIVVTEPKSDPWVQRTPAKDEQPEDNQFFARDDKNEGTLFYNGTLEQAADAVFLKLYADDKLIKTDTQKPTADKSYAFTVKLKPGLVHYKVEFGTQTGTTEKVTKTVNNLVCGDAYIIDGQSNAEATGPNNGPTEDPETPVSEWIRSYGNQLDGTTRGGWGNAVRTHIWGKPNYGNHQIGAWGIELATNLVAKHGIPICMINGAYGGTPIWLHQVNPANRFDTSGDFYVSPYKIYGGLLTRVTAAKLTHGIRGVFWHQGENDSGSGAPTGDWNYKSYQQYFVDMAAAWKQDYPNIKNYYVYQIWPLPCGMGPKDDFIREAQRTLPSLFSNLRVMSTVGAASEHAGRGSCHFDLVGYAKFAAFMSPLVEQDAYGLVPQQPITAPNLKRAWFTSAKRDEIALDFGQPVVWKDELKQSFYLDDAVAPISSGTVSDNLLTLKLTAPSDAKAITYLTGKDWDGKPEHLIFGANGIAALTFCDVGIAPSATGEPARLSFEPTMESMKQYETPEWYADAKLGIYMHWGPMSIPGVATTWYARWIYEQGSEGNKYHVATYGHPSKFGYKDICKLFTAPKFDQAQADRYVKLYKQAGARYVVPVAVHHDNFDMWDSKYQPRWNSVVTAGKDVVGMWKKAADKEGLRLGVASHFARTYRWLQPSHGADRSGPMAGVPYDGQDPAYADLYGEKWKDNGSYPDFWYEQRSDVGPPGFEKNFEDRLRDLMDKYHPDLYYTDGGIPFKQAGLNVLSHFYNANQQWNNGKLQAVATIKLDWTPNVATNNYEFGYPDTVQHYPWQSDKTMGADWYWIRNATKRYMPVQNAIHMLIDTVSKGGNLLLNVPLTPEGELEPETITFLTDMGRCLDLMGEALFATRCWVVANDGDGGIRFTRNKDNTVLYVTNLGWSNDQLVVRTLGSSRIDLTSLTGVTLLGSAEKLTYTQDAEGLKIKLGKPPFEAPAYAFKLTFSGQIPRLK
jgi:alpha-L-fucosidase